MEWGFFLLLVVNIWGFLWLDHQINNVRRKVDMESDKLKDYIMRTKR